MDTLGQKHIVQNGSVATTVGIQVHKPGKLANR